MARVLTFLALLALAPAAGAQPAAPLPPQNQPLPPPPGPDDPRMSDARLVEDFITVALGREFPEDGARTGRLVRWTRPIRVAGMGPRPQVWSRTLEWHMRRLARISGHPIELRAGGEVDLIAIFVPRLTADAVAAHADVYRRVFSDEIRYEAQMARIAAGALNAVCFTSVRVDRDFSITAAIAFIPLDRGPAVVRQCIIEEMTQALGLPNDSDDVDPSIFNDHSPYVEMTDKDILLLRMLYHPALRPGMTEAQVRRAAPRVLADLRRRPYRD
jgi:hypothetical protein